MGAIYHGIINRISAYTLEPSCLVYLGLMAITLFLSVYVKRENDLPGSMTRARNTAMEFAVFTLLTAVSACRIAVGNDYWVYRENFNLIVQSRRVSSENGFNRIVLIMNDLFGYDKYLPIFGLFSILTCIFFCLALHHLGEHYSFSLFLLFVGGYYFNSLNSVRYYLALAIALYSMKYVLERKYLLFLLWIFIGMNFHKSILLVVPVYLLAFLVARFFESHRMNPRLFFAGIGLLGLFLASLIFCKDMYRSVIFTFYPYYEGSAFDNGSVSYVNIAKCLGVLLLCAIGHKGLKENLTYRFYTILNGLGLIVYCLGSFIPETSRIGYYMIVSQIFLIPGLLDTMENKKLKKLCTLAVTLCFLLYFAMMLLQMYDKNIRLLPYRNWIFN